MAEDLSAEDRAMLLKEAEWIREDAKDAEAKVDRLIAINAAAAYAVLGWVFGKVLQQPLSIETADQTLWALRSRPDVALAVCAIPIIGALFTTIQLEAGARWVSYLLQLVRVAVRLGTATRWMWRMRVESTQTVETWRGVFGVFLLLFVALPMAGSLWFVYPAAQRSGIVRAVWWLAIVAIALSGAASIAFTRSLRKTLLADAVSEDDHGQASNN